MLIEWKTVFVSGEEVIMQEEGRWPYSIGTYVTKDGVRYMVHGQAADYDNGFFILTLRKFEGSGGDEVERTDTATA